jgi:multimeric flavodoxin WrbA
LDKGRVVVTKKSIQENQGTRVVVINGSVRMEKGLTGQILTPFVEGMRQAGAVVDMFYVKRMNILPCTGDLSCWYTHPGRCHIADDMQKLYPKLRKADILVIATPVYVPLPGEMQNVLNRIVCLLEEVVTVRKGRTRGRLRAGINIKNMVLVSSSGWWEKGNFGTVERIVRELAEDASVNYAGALLRPHIDWFGKDPMKANTIVTAARKVGFQLVSKGAMSKDLLNIIAQPLITQKQFLSHMAR